MRVVWSLSHIVEHFLCLTYSIIFYWVTVNASAKYSISCKLSPWKRLQPASSSFLFYLADRMSLTLTSSKNRRPLGKRTKKWIKGKKNGSYSIFTFKVTFKGHLKKSSSSSSGIKSVRFKEKGLSLGERFGHGFSSARVRFQTAPP